MPDPDNENASWRGPLIALVAVALLVVAAWFVIHELSAAARLQDCLLSARPDCAPIRVAAR